MAAEAGRRGADGANYRSDLETGFALGQAVAKQGSPARHRRLAGEVDGTVPTGPGIGVERSTEPLQGLEAMADDAGRPVRPGHARCPDQRSSRRSWLAEADQQSPTPSSAPLPPLCPSRGATSSGSRLCAGAPVSGSVCPVRCGCWRRLRPVFRCLHRRARCEYTYWRLRPSMADPTIVPFIPLPKPSRLRLEGRRSLLAPSAALVGAMFPQEAANGSKIRAGGVSSRIYGGIHYLAMSDGNQMGKSIAHWRSSAISSTVVSPSRVGVDGSLWYSAHSRQEALSPSQRPRRTGVLRRGAHTRCTAARGESFAASRRQCPTHVQVAGHGGCLGYLSGLPGVPAPLQTPGRVCKSCHTRPPEEAWSNSCTRSRQCPPARSWRALPHRTASCIGPASRSRGLL